MQSQLSYIASLHEKGGPQPHDYTMLDSNLSQLSEHLQDKASWHVAMDILKQYAPGLVSEETMQGFMIQKPHGYAGDFEIIERLYNRYTSSDEAYKAWDEYMHYLPAAKAVCNRKDYFKTLMKDTVRHHDTVNVLNVASGPARDLYEFLIENPTYDIQVDCVDQDKNAIDFASKRCELFSERVHFHQANALKFKTDKKYDLVWSAGLFDYFDDTVFVKALYQLMVQVKPGGELVIGNFADGNPSKPYMEVVSWHLHHRSAVKLRKLALEARVNPDNITFGIEPEGVNLFLHIRK